MLAGSIAAVCAVATDVALATQSEPPAVFGAYVTERLRAHVLAEACTSHPVDARLRAFFEMPSVQDLWRQLREARRDARAMQFGQEPLTTPGPSTHMTSQPEESAVADSQVLGV